MVDSVVPLSPCRPGGGETEFQNAQRIQLLCSEECDVCWSKFICAHTLSKYSKGQNGVLVVQHNVLQQY